MKSLLKYLLIGLFTSTFHSCTDMDVDPKHIQTDDVIFSSENGVNAFLYNLYKSLPIEEFNYNTDKGYDNQGIYEFGKSHWDAKWTGRNCFEYSEGSINYNSDYWPYERIRNANIFIEKVSKLKDDPTSAFSTETLDQWLGEAYFVRAYIYFSLVKRKGGVPIVDQVQQYNGNVEELQVPRNMEESCWDFISSDFDKAMSLMSDVSVGKGRANKYVAAAYKSRAMLYAACIAKYGDEEIYNSDLYKKFVGIPKGKAAAYFQQSYDAAKLLEGHYSLYMKKSDNLEQNYVDLFLDEDSPENIFVKDYYTPKVDNGLTEHNLDGLVLPSKMSSASSSGGPYMIPTLNALELFGEIQSTDPDGSLHPVNSPKEFFREFNRFEPRVYATFYFPGDELRNEIFDIQKGIYPKFTGDVSDEFISAGQGVTPTYWEAPDGQSYPINGDCGFDVHSGTKTGLFQRKYVDYRIARDDAKFNDCHISWIDMRYAEVMLNRAEAAFELGLLEDAFEQYSKIRERAGAEQKFDKSTLTLNEIHLERRRELMFESHAFWDLRRWRTFDKEFDNLSLRTIYPFWIYDGNEKYKGKYIYVLRDDFSNTKMTFSKSMYYEMIPDGELAKNPNLYPQNPGY